MFHITPKHTARLGAVAAAAAFALLLAACSSNDNSNSSSSSSASSSSSNSSSSSGGSSTAATKVTALEKLPTSYPLPTTSVSGVSSLKGKTVYYIPLTAQSPQFAVTQAGLTAALKAAGLEIQVCNGNATPTAISACFSQAVKAKAAAIVTDAIQYQMAANAFSSATSAGIPVLSTDIASSTADGEPGPSKDLGYVLAPASGMMEAVADWITADSGGNANVLINEDTDGPSPLAYVAAGQAEFKSVCPGCTVATNQISSANFQQVPGSTASALQRNPSTNYVVSEFDQFLQPTQAGVQQAGMTSAVKGVSGAGQLAGFQQLAQNNFLYADVGQASAYQGWVDADAVFRMLSGTSGASLPDYTIPIRLFTRDNVKDITLSAAAQASGEWFGPTSFTTSFEKLWGIS